MRIMLDCNRVMPEVVQVVPDDEFGIYAYFNDGTVRYKSLKKLIEQGGVFEKLQDISVFKSSLTVMNGTVAWDPDDTWDETRVLDIDPLDLYETATVVKCPLS